MARVVTVTYTFTVADDAHDAQVEQVLADAFAQIDEATTGRVYQTQHLSRPGFPTPQE